jgi:hypothetical protein
MSVKQAIKKAFRKFHGRVPAPDVAARELTDATWETMAAMVQEQVHLFVDLGQVKEDRRDLAFLVAASLYRTGLTTISAKILHQLIREEELVDLVFDYLCLYPQLQAQRRLYTQLTKRQEYAHYVRKSADGENSVSKVPANERTNRHWRGNGRIGTRRDARRTGRCEPRTMPESDLPS